MKLIHFKSYSSDNYYMKVEDENQIPKTRDDILEFMKNHLEYDYFEPYKYTFFHVYTINENGFVFIPLSFGEWDVIDTKKLKDGKFYFSDHIDYYVNKGYSYRAEDVNKMKGMKRPELLKFLEENSEY